MKTIFSFTALILISITGTAQCVFSDSYTNNSGWTQVGNNVEISNGKVNYLSGASDGQQRRVYKNLGFTLDSNHIWSAAFEFIPTQVGNWGGPATGHTLIALTAGTKEPYNDCPNIPCTGYPAGTQDGVMISYVTTNPTDPANHISNTIFFKINARHNGTEYRSSNILTGTVQNTTYYLELQRTSSTYLELGVFSDSNKTIHLPNSPIFLTIPSGLTGLNTVQHGNTARGDFRRQLTGTIDNLCLINNNVTSLNEEGKTLENFSVYPNPTSTNVSILGIKENSTIRFFNLTGQMVLQTFKQKNISVDHLESGIYFVQIEEKGITRTRKLIIQ